MILKLRPALKHYVWGGTNLITDYNKHTDGQTLAETWELSFNGNGLCYVVGGEHDGKALRDVVTPNDLGANCQRFGVFPTLVKLINAKTPLSLQVHPDDNYALQHEGTLGKTEMWHILSAADNAYIYLGFNKAVTKQQFTQALRDKTLCSLLNKVTVKAGDTYLVPSGTIHAIGAGVTLIEVQQNSDVTYRVFDYDRMGVDGKPRPLHVDKALDVLDFGKYDVPDPARKGLLGACKYFTARRVSAHATVFEADSFAAVTALADLTVGGVALCKGETAFVSANQAAEIRGQGEFILVTV